MIKRNADWLWRCAGAISPGMINCNPANNEPVIEASPLSPGFISIKTRRVASIALISLPDAIQQGIFALVSWLSQTFLQLVLLSVIMVGQQVLAKASEKQALQTSRDAEAVLALTDQVHKLIAVNNRLTDEIHAAVIRSRAPASAPA